MFFERQGASKPPLTFLPRIPPRIVRGNPTEGRDVTREEKVKEKECCKKEKLETGNEK